MSHDLVLFIILLLASYTINYAYKILKMHLVCDHCIQVSLSPLILTHKFMT